MIVIIARIDTFKHDIYTRHFLHLTNKIVSIALGGSLLIAFAEPQSG